MAGINTFVINLSKLFLGGRGGVQPNANKFWPRHKPAEANRYPLLRFILPVGEMSYLRNESVACESAAIMHQSLFWIATSVVIKALSLDPYFLTPHGL